MRLITATVKNGKIEINDKKGNADRSARFTLHNDKSDD